MAAPVPDVPAVTPCWVRALLHLPACTRSSRALGQGRLPVKAAIAGSASPSVSPVHASNASAN